MGMTTNTHIALVVSLIFAVCKDSYVVYAVVLTEWENENDSQNQCESMQTLCHFANWRHCHDVTNIYDVMVAMQIAVVVSTIRLID